ncbi:MAG: DUF1553 domain-containing protein [Cyclobacteriaceae bacterium]
MVRTLFFGLFFVLLSLSACRNEPEKVDFSTQVKPIINKHCISCHGGVKRNANFSLLFREDALDTAESGRPAIIPGDPEHSEFVRRLTIHDPEERMPYKEAPLAQEEIELLTQWIREGANWGQHWAYVAPKPVPVPNAGWLLGGWFGDDWKHNEIDYFVEEKLAQQHLKPSAPADKADILRRVSLDLTGVPPPQAWADAYLHNDAEGAYEQLVDSLLQSPRYGEKWASWWLDMARYSDTKGYERDVYRNIWRYRDWVIRSLNEDKPFDQFTTEQLAGDLLPDPTDEQLIATAFHRNTMNNDEGGTEDEEFRTAAVLDRVNTTMQVWQSTTIGCVQCHSHPYDPFRQEEFYKMMAFFNNTRDEDTEGEHPNLRQYAPAEQKQLQEIIAWIKSREGDPSANEAKWFMRTLEPKIHPHDFDQFVNGELIDTKWLGIRPEGSARLRNIDLTEKRYLIINYRTRTPGGWMEIRLDDLHGPSIATHRIDSVKQGRRAVAIPIKATSGKHNLFFVFHHGGIKPDQAVADIEWFAFRQSGWFDDLQHRQALLRLINVRADETPIVVENTSEQFRPTPIFERGNWLVHGKEVSPTTPRSLNAFPDNTPANRLGLAQWLVSPQNPLTARTLVNRVWEQFYGTGLVETLEDLGTQGATPSHPELLDWLAVRLMQDHHWSMKKLMKDIVMSGTYRQANGFNDLDPTNKWLSHGPAVRMSAEQIRDQALTVSGLLSSKMYGPGVMPYQPDGVWQSVWSDARWVNSEGEDKYRRAVYVFQKRTSPYPSMMTFDGSSRDVCVVRRIRTNTPLQSLVTMNDPVFMEAARALATRMKATGSRYVDQIQAGYRYIHYKEMSDKKLAALEKLYQESLSRYQSNEALRTTLVGDAKPEDAALTLVASALLNLDESLTK